MRNEIDDIFYRLATHILTSPQDANDPDPDWLVNGLKRTPLLRLLCAVKMLCELETPSISLNITIKQEIRNAYRAIKET